MALALLVTLACHRPHYAVVSVDVSPSLWPASVVALDGKALQKILAAQLALIPSLHPVKDPEKVPDATARYQLVFTPTLVGTPQKGGAVMAGVLLRREQGGLSARYPVSAQVRFDPGQDEGAIQKALSQATAQALDSARLQVAALEASRSTLHEDLKAKDPRVRAFALSRLAELKDPAATAGLKETLASDDPNEVRRAAGGLVSLGDRSAVPALIDATRHRPPELQRELLYAVGELGGDEAEAYLYTVSQGADLEPIRAAAQEALEALQARRDPRGPTAQQESQR